MAASGPSPKIVTQHHDSKFDNTFDALTCSAIQRIGGAGMLQYHFIDEAAAKTFLTWVHDHKEIKDINKASIQKTQNNDDKKDVYIIRLTQTQRNQLQTKPSLDIKQQHDSKKLIDECAKQLLNVNLSKDECIKILNTYDTTIINAALPLQNYKKSTGLHIAAWKQPGDAFIQLIQKASAEAINAALPLQNPNKWTGLYIAAWKQPGDAFIQLIQKASAETINAALPLQDDYKWTGLHVAALHQPGDAFIQLIQKASAETINAALPLQDNDHDTALHIAAHRQPGDAFIQLIQKADAKVINAALSMTNSTDNATTLHYIVYYQSEIAVKATITKASTEALSKACLIINNQNQSVLECALPYLQADAIAALLNKIDDNAFEFMITHKMKSPRLASAVISNLIFEPSWQTEPLLSRACKLLHSEIAPACCEAWLQGHEIPSALLKALSQYSDTILQHLKATQSETQLAEIKHIFTMLQPQDSKDLKSDQKHHPVKDNKMDAKITFTTRLGTSIPVTTKDEKQLKQLFNEGLKSPYDFRLLKQYAPNTTATQIAEDLRRADILYTGAPIELDLASYQEYPDKYLVTAKQGHAIFKIIKVEYKDEKGQPKNDWNDFVAQLKDYNKRPNLRKITDKSASRYKFHHRITTIIKYNEHKEKKKTYLTTKKQSATLLSQQFNTTVFGEHVAGRQLVGILARIDCTVKLQSELPKQTDLVPNEYIVISGDEKESSKLYYIDDHKHPHRMLLKYVDEKHAIPQKPLSQWTESEKENVKKIITDYHDKRINKALLTRDKGTYQRRWIGSKEEAEAHAREMQDINYTSLEKFKEEVQKYPHRLNELLTKFTRHSIMAILIVSDNPDSRKLARERHTIYKNELGIDLPIVFYNRNLRCLRIYSPSEQYDDQMEDNSIQFKIKIYKKREIELAQRANDAKSPMISIATPAISASTASAASPAISPAVIPAASASAAAIPAAKQINANQLAHLYTLLSEVQMLQHEWLKRRRKSELFLDQQSKAEKTKAFNRLNTRITRLIDTYNGQNYDSIYFDIQITVHYAYDKKCGAFSQVSKTNDKAEAVVTELAKKLPFLTLDEKNTYPDIIAMNRLIDYIAPEFKNNPKPLPQNINANTLADYIGLYTLAHDITMLKITWLAEKGKSHDDKTSKLNAFSPLNNAVMRWINSYPTVSYNEIFKEVRNLLANAYNKNGCFSGVATHLLWKDRAETLITNIKNKLTEQYAHQLKDTIVNDLRSTIDDLMNQNLHDRMTTLTTIATKAAATAADPANQKTKQLSAAKKP